MKHVLRIEHKTDGLGPFSRTNGDELEVLTDALIARMEREQIELPVVYFDIPEVAHCMLLGNREYVCGAEYISHLYEWFGADLGKLYSAGYRLKMYLLPADKVLYGYSGMQVAFRKEDAIEQEDITPDASVQWFVMQR
jgi:hypothetical protein